MTTNSTPQPFQIKITDAELDDLHRRLDTARWPDPAPDNRTDFARGVPLPYLQQLSDYWRRDFDWRDQEARLNQIPQFTTEIDGQQIHYLHVRSPEPDALPLLIIHGYPSSVVEFLELIGPLCDPQSHGGDSRDAFDLVIPSLPGFGFSTPVRQSGWELGRTTAAFADLMARLGYSRYGAHGGDIGAGVAGRLGATDSEHVVGTIVVADPGALGLAGEQFPIPDHLTDEERARVEQERTTWRAERGYLDLQAHRPETIAAALTDSPVGQLAWIVEKFQTWTNPASKTPDQAVDRDQLLTNVSLYWFTRSGATAARFLYEAEHSNLDWIAPAGVPSGWVVFNTDPIMRRFMDPQQQMAYWNEHPEGGHFAAMEEPGLLADDLRAFFRDFR
jgi:pimeloyl-ACP methyl ester carboxylesterase